MNKVNPEDLDEMVKLRNVFIKLYQDKDKYTPVLVRNEEDHGNPFRQRRPKKSIDNTIKLPDQVMKDIGVLVIDNTLANIAERLDNLGVDVKAMRDQLDVKPKNNGPNPDDEDDFNFDD